MPRTVTIERVLYSFDELNEKAKERARDKYREDLEVHYDFVYDDAKTVGALMGIEIDDRAYRTLGGFGKEPAIYWSGFSCQGDGACFEGSYSFNGCALEQVKTHVGEDEEIFRIAAELDRLQTLCSGQLSAKVRHSGHYYHSRCTDIEVEINLDDDIWNDVRFKDVEEDLRETLRDFMDWIYKQLEAEYDYQNSDEAIDQYLKEMTFSETGCFLSDHD